MEKCGIVQWHYWRKSGNMLKTIGIAIILAIGTFVLCDLIGTTLVMCLDKFHSSNRKKNLFSRVFKSRRTEKAKEGYPTITFDKFLELYAVNPSMGY